MTLITTDIKDKLKATANKVRKHTVFLFIIFLLGIYSYLAWLVIALDQVEPDPSVVTTKVKTAGVPHIDPDVLVKIQQLQDNSVEVQTLFDQARSNPFKE